MSVINTVLNKLDQRGAARPAGMPAVVANKAAAARWRLPLIVAIGSTAVAAAAFADWPGALGLGASTTAMTPPAITPPMSAPAGEPVKLAALNVADLGDAEPAAITPLLLPDVRRPAAPPASAVAGPAKVAALAPASRVAMALPSAPAQPAPPLPRIDKHMADVAPTQRAAALHREAIELAQTGHAHSAKERLREALKAHPSHTPSRVLLALLEHDTGAHAQAITLLRDGLTRQPGEASMALMLSRLLAAAGDGAQALAVLDEHRLADAAAQGLRAGLLTQSGDWRQALSAYESAARQEPTNAAWWFGLGITLDAQGDAPRARQAFARAQTIGLAQADQAAYAEQRLRALD